MIRVFLDHGEAYGNLGDEAMLRSALRRLSARLAPVVFVVPREGDRPLPALVDYNIEEVPSPYTSFVRMYETRMYPFWIRAAMRIAGKRGMLRHLAAADLMVRSGRLAAIDSDFREFHQGLQSCDAFYGVGAADFNDFNARGAAYKIWLYRIARGSTSVVAVAAQGFGPLENPELVQAMREGFQALDFLSFRDHAYSSDFTRSLGPLRCETKVVGDEAFGLSSADSGTTDLALASSGLKYREPFVVVHWRGTDYTQDTHGLIPNLARACDYIADRTSAKILFVPMSYDIHSGNDADLVNALRDNMRLPEQLLALPLQRDVSVVRAVIGRALFTVGLSYHVHVFSLSQGNPALILYSGEYYRYKSDGLVDFYGPPSAALDLASANPDQIAAAIDMVVSDRSTSRAAITAMNARILGVNDWTIERLADRLRKIGDESLVSPRYRSVD